MRIGVFIVSLVPALLFPGLVPLFFPIGIYFWEDSAPTWYLALSGVLVLVAAWIGYSGYLAHEERQFSTPSPEQVGEFLAQQALLEGNVQQRKELNAVGRVKGTAILHANTYGSTLRCDACGTQWDGPALGSSWRDDWWRCPQGCGDTSPHPH